MTEEKRAPIVNLGVYSLDDTDYTKESIITSIPLEFSLSAPYPNPFNSFARFSYQIPFSSKVSLQAYNNLGQHVITLYDGFRSPGTYNSIFKVNALPSGNYFIQLRTSGDIQTRQVFLIK